MKNVLFLLLVTSLCSLQARAQEAEAADETAAAEVSGGAEAAEAPAATTTMKKTERPAVSTWVVGASTLQWNEPLRIQQGVLNANDVANFNGIIVTADKETYYYRWGFSVGGFIGSGRANGGNNNTLITYDKNKVAFTMLGVAPRGFYRLSGRVNAGVTAFVFTKNIDWPKDNSTQTIDSGRNLNAMALLDLNIRLFNKWDFYQGVGPLAEGSTLWKLGLNYRF